MLYQTATYFTDGFLVTATPGNAIRRCFPNKKAGFPPAYFLENQFLALA